MLSKMCNYYVLSKNTLDIFHLKQPKFYVSLVVTKSFFCSRFMPNPRLKNAVFFQAVAKFSFYCIRISNQVFFWDLSIFMTDQKSTIFNLIRWVAWSMGQWDDCCINQGSDVPSIIFFRIFPIISISQKFLIIFFIHWKKQEQTKK